MHFGPKVFSDLVQSAPRLLNKENKEASRLLASQLVKEDEGDVVR